MRTTRHIAILMLPLLAGCTVKDVDVPALAGPSTMAHSLSLVADRHTLTQNGVDYTDIRITALGPGGQSENIPLRAQVFVDGIAQDFGTLSTKSPITPAIVRYTAPAASTLVGGQVPTTVTIAVTPASAGDFRGEIARQVDIQVLPQGVIIPTNPNLVANFTVTPESPMAFQTTTLDASATTNNGTACFSACAYSWNFGDGTSGSGITTTHQFRTVGNVVVTLTVTDARGAQSVQSKTVVVQQPTPPTIAIDVTPTSPSVGRDTFFSAARSTGASGRSIVSYQWSFGDGNSGTGATTTHRYSAPGTYTVTLRATDDVGATATQTTTITVALGGPAVSFTILPAQPRPNQPVTINITATPTSGTTVRSYTINWGDGQIETVTSPTQSHIYGGPGAYVISVTATDSLGHTTTVTQQVTVTNP